MLLSDEIRYLAMTIKSNPLRFSLDEIIDKLEEFEEMSIKLEEKVEELENEIK